LHPQSVERTGSDGFPIVAGRSAGWAPRPLASDHRQLVGFLRLRTCLLVRTHADERDRSSWRALTTRGAPLLHERTDSSQRHQRFAMPCWCRSRATAVTTAMRSSRSNGFITTASAGSCAASADAPLWPVRSTSPAAKRDWRSLR